MAVANVLTKLAAIFASPSYAARIPESVRTKIATNGFGSTEYTPDEYNAIYSSLLNMVAKQTNHAFRYYGIDFEKYNKGFLAYGDVIIDNYVDLADVGTIPTLINTKGDNGGVTTVDPFSIKWANVKTAYYVGTYELQYAMTTRMLEVKKAFISDSNVTNFIALCRSVLPESCRYDRWLIFRNMLASDTIYSSTTDYELSADTIAPEDALQIILMIKNVADAMSNMTTKYNKLGVTTATDKSDLVLWINKGIYSAIKNAMKNVYHNEVDFGVGAIEELPDFGESAATTGQFAALTDRRGIYLYDTLSPFMDTIWNPKGLYWNNFLSYQGKIAYGLHYNAAKFTLSQKAAA